MTKGTLVVLSLSGILMSGCQSWSVRDIDSLPPTAALPDESEQGTVDLRYFNDVEGTDINALTGLARFPNNPDEIVQLNRLEVSDGRGDNYGSLVRGYIEPPADGFYRFFVSGDDETQFFLSTDQSAANASLVATVPSWSLQGEYDKFSSQSSPVIELEAGKRYFFQLIHKEGVLGDHFSVAWEGPGFARSVIEGQFLYSVAKSSELYPDDPMATEAYGRGYRAGFFDGKQGLAFSPGYPPLDEDRDGLYDNWEVQAGLNPANATDAGSDQDDDLLTATDEYLIGTNPTVVDTDGDGIPDGAEYAFGIDPLDPTDAQSDLDGDGYSNLEEYLANTDLSDPQDLPVVDEPTVSPSLVAGVAAQYFSGRNLDEFVLARQESEISNDWGNGSPADGIPDNTFSARWFTKLIPPHESGQREYEFRALRDDGVRVYIDGELVLDAWAGVTTREYTGRVTLSAATEHEMRVEFTEGYGGARLSLDLVDLTTGETVDPASTYFIVPMDATASQDSDGDSIPDVWEMQNGLNAWVADAETVYNSQGVSGIEAYESGVNPWTLEDAAMVEVVDDSGSDGTTTTEPPTTTDPEPVPPPTVDQVTLSWTAPGTRVDGTSISLSEIDSYQINFGQSAGNLTQTVTVSGEETSYTFDQLEPGVWYFSVSVRDSAGLLSAPSEVVSETIQ
ncbi:PA14 domain-containing protein [Marinobacter adhaerens]|uniref:PA14 domain-containing protein n=1 Tax=Marinobacter adhaerens TaxID=1033846 RepID=UPI001E2BEC54|nr:PA14 domain-containing protein [Marinobacter adhaerens]MCD1647048.1 fibronectin type III domain-containing protein [Marinobacter adhaerens]